MSLKIELLSQQHVKNSFDCGYSALNDYIRLRAKQDVKKDLSVCYVLVDESNNNVMGYYTLSSSSVNKSDLPDNLSKKLPYSAIPVILLGRLAVDNGYKGNRYGEVLLMHSFAKSCDSSDIIGAHAIIVEPIDEKAELFYKKYDFIKLNGTGKMFIAIDTIRKSLM